MTDIGKVTGSVEVKDGFSDTFGKAKGGLSAVTVGFGALAAGAAVAGGAIAAATLKALNFADAMDNQAKATQTGVEALQVFNIAAEQAGQSSSSITSGLQRLQRSIGEPTKQATEAFARLGVNVQQLKALKPEEQFELIFKQLATIPNAADKTATAMALLGRSGASLLALSGDALPKLNERFRELGLILDKDVVAKVDKAEENLDLLKRTVGGTFTNLGAAVAQTAGFNEAIIVVTNTIGAFSASIGGSSTTITDWINGAIKFAIDNVRILTLVVNEIIGFYSKFTAVILASADAIASPIDAIKGQVESLNNLGATLDIIDEKTKATGAAIQTTFVEAALSVEEMATATDNLAIAAAAAEAAAAAQEARQIQLNSLYAAGVLMLNASADAGVMWSETLGEAGEAVIESFEPVNEGFRLLESNIGGLASATEAAFARAGLKTRTELQATSAQALADFNAIQASGEATAEALEVAWQNYLDARAEAEGAGNKVTEIGFADTLTKASSALGAFAAKSKVAAIAQAGIDAALAIIKVFATTAFPASLVAAASIGVATAVQIAKIKSAKTGFQEGTPGLDFKNFGAAQQVELHNEEAVVPKDRVGDFASQVAEALGGGSRGGAGSTGPSILELDGEVLARWIERNTKSGRVRVHQSSVRDF